MTTRPKGDDTATHKVADENVDVNVAPNPVDQGAKRKTFSLYLDDESGFRKRLKMNSVYGWMLDSTPRRRELFKNARVTIGRPDSFVGLPSMPSLVVLHGIEPTTWNKSIQALFSTQNCDVMFTLCSAIVYYQKCLQVCSNPDPTEHVQNGDNPDVNDSATRNYIFMAANVLAMKFYDDLHLSNNYISRVYRVPLKILNKWEVKVLDLLNYSLYLSQAELDQVKLDFVTRIEP